MNFGRNGRGNLIADREGEAAGKIAAASAGANAKDCQ
jgi:hypothetical protein